MSSCTDDDLDATVNTPHALSCDSSRSHVRQAYSLHLFWTAHPVCKALKLHATITAFKDSKNPDLKHSFSTLAFY